MSIYANLGVVFNSLQNRSFSVLNTCLRVLSEYLSSQSLAPSFSRFLSRSSIFFSDFVSTHHLFLCLFFFFIYFWILSIVFVQCIVSLVAYPICLLFSSLQSHQLFFKIITNLISFRFS